MPAPPNTASAIHTSRAPHSAMSANRSRPIVEDPSVATAEEGTSPADPSDPLTRFAETAPRVSRCTFTTRTKANGRTDDRREETMTVAHQDRPAQAQLCNGMTSGIGSLPHRDVDPVSYTHLTLPTIYSV